MYTTIIRGHGILSQLSLPFLNHDNNIDMKRPNSLKL